MSDSQDDKAARKRIADDVWCRTCDTVHIAYIPVTTFRCADCGFGQWAEDLAESHASAFPSHVVYSLVHEGEPPMTDDPVRPQETLRGKLVEEFGEHRIHLRSGRCACGQTVGSDPRRIQRHVADAVLPIVEEETARLRRDLDIAESVAGARQINYREQYDRVLEWALRDQRRAGDAEDSLAALRDKVKALADEADKRLAEWREAEREYGTFGEVSIGLSLSGFFAEHLLALVEEPQGGEQ